MKQPPSHHLYLHGLLGALLVASVTTYPSYFNTKRIREDRC